MQEPAAPDYLLVGHVTVDRLTQRRVTLGGTATYGALVGRSMGARVAIHTSASHEPGLVDTLYGTMIARVPSAFTTCFSNRYEEGVRYQTLESIANPLTYDQLLPEWRNPPLVHLAPLCQEVDPSLVDRFPRSLVCVTPQGWMRRWDAAGAVSLTDWQDAQHILPRADAVVISEDDVADRALIQEWARLARLLVVTRARHGCIVYKQGEEPYTSAAFVAAREADPTGAGDVFAGAYFLHLQRTGNWREAADWANCVASFAVEKRGWAAVPTLAAVDKRWKAGARLEPAETHS